MNGLYAPITRNDTHTASNMSCTPYSAHEQASAAPSPYADIRSRRCLNTGVAQRTAAASVTAYSLK